STGFPSGPRASRQRDARRVVPPARRSTVFGYVLQHGEHGPGRYTGGALGRVAPRAAGVVSRAGHVDVRPTHAVGDELAEENPGHQHAGETLTTDIGQVGHRRLQVLL